MLQDAWEELQSTFPELSPAYLLQQELQLPSSELLQLCQQAAVQAAAGSHAGSR